MLLDTPVCDFGWQAPEFSLPNLDGTLVSLPDVLGDKGGVVIFMCNHCPYVVAIIDRLVADARALQADGIGVVGIMSNDYHHVPADSPDAMRAFAHQHNIGFPYLLDEDQSVARAYGAVCTPDIFGFDKTGSLQYRGRFDSAGMQDGASRTADLLEAMRLVASTGKGPTDQVASAGCSIKWRRAG